MRWIRYKLYFIKYLWRRVFKWGLDWIWVEGYEGGIQKAGVN